MLARSEINSIESKISEALINNQISNADFLTIINEEKKYGGLKETTKMINTQRSDVEKVMLIEESKTMVLMKLLSLMKLLITAQNKEYM